MRITKAQKKLIRQAAMKLACEVKRTGELPIALIIDETEHQVRIVCPYCRQVHIHGTAKGNPEGPRVPHCLELNGMPNYIVKRPD